MGIKDIFRSRRNNQKDIADIPEFNPQYRDPDVSKAHRLAGIRRADAQVRNASLSPEIEQEALEALEERRQIAHHLPDVQLELPADSDNSQVVPPNEEPGV